MANDTSSSTNEAAGNITTGNSGDTSSTSQNKGFFQNFIDTIRREIRDISYVEIVTAVGETTADVNPDAELVIKGVKNANLKIMARTRIELDGDIIVILPGNTENGQTVIDKEIMTIHKENVAVAVGNWNIFMQNMFNALKLVMEVTGLSKSDVFNDFKQPLPPSGGQESTTTS